MSKDTEQRDSIQRARKVSSVGSFLTTHGIQKIGSSEFFPQTLPTAMKQTIQENTTSILRKIRGELKEFTLFVDDLQKKTPQEWQMIAVCSTPESPTGTETSNSKPLHPIHSLPDSAPLRDAFQIVRNLLWRMSSVIDEVASATPVPDDGYKQARSPQYDRCYAQYVFQLTLYVLQVVGEQLENFSKALGETIAEDASQKMLQTNNALSAETLNVLNRGKISETEDNLRDLKDSLNKSVDSTEACSEETIVPKTELRKRASDALELLIFLSEKMLHYFYETGLPAFDRIQQQEFSRKALGIPDLCRNCSKKVIRQLRRYSSRENLHEEKYEKESDETLQWDTAQQKSKERRAHFENDEHESPSPTSNYVQKCVSKSKTCEWNSPSCSKVFADCKKIPSEQLQMRLEGFQQEAASDHAHVSTSLKEPLVSGMQESRISNQEESEGMFAGVLNLTDDLNLAESERLNFLKPSDQINFNVQLFCSLLKAQFRKILTEEDKKNSVADTNLIMNTVIYCLRESTKATEKNITTPNALQFQASGGTSREADVEDNVKRECVISAEEHEKKLDEAVDKFVTETYKYAVGVLEKSKDSKVRLGGHNIRYSG
ncbi:uncharacterized protein CDAR_599781 [Caerostris darwini]|uniref:Uncharacterized protein n=1 Tax=Caerostris darwini TaxID=1538125 RepID=A0AAV4R946_9ARAC|nr:uncharacterized protein CDAR_599781 [Caerostris darwini]